MSVEEEVELRDLVAQTLELSGCLPKIRAQLRANLCLALDEDTKISKQQPLLNNKIKSHFDVPEGQLMFCIVREFLEYFDLDYTISVYEPESYVGSCYKYEGRQKIIEDLGLKTAEEDFSGPVLLELVKIAQTKSKTININLTNINGEKIVEQKESDRSCSLSSLQDQVNGHSDLSEVGKNFVSKRNNKEEKHHVNVDHARKKTVSLEHVEKNTVIAPNLLEVPLDSTYIKNEPDNDDTFNGTSSIEEETVNGTDSSGDMKQKSVVDEEENISSVSQEASPELKSKSEEKNRTLQKSDKLKSKLELSPLQLNKPRGSDILPSLYSKDFKDKNKDFDFDIKDDYEEDFMSGSEVEFSLSKVDCPKPLLEELQHYERSGSSENMQSSFTSKNKISIIEQHNNSKNSNSYSKVNNNSTATNSIETNISVGYEVANNSSE